MSPPTSTGQVIGRIRVALGVRGGEVPLVGWMAGLFAVTQASHGLGANSADALFFLRFGVEQLPLMILFSGVAVMVVTVIYATGLGLRGPGRWLPLTTGLAALWVLLEWGGVFLDNRVIYPVIWVSTQMLIMVTFTMMWNAAESACDTRQAKRLFPVFATAGVAGGVVGNLATGPLAAQFGAPSLLLAQAILLGGSTLVLIRLRPRFHDDPADTPVSVRSELSAGVAAVRSSRLLKLAAAGAFALSALFFLVVFPFSRAVADAYPTEAEVAGFLGLFASAATALTFLVSLFVTNRLLARLGIVVSLMVVPLLYAGGFALWLISFGLATAALVRGLQWVGVNAIWGTAFPALFNVLTGRRRGQVMAFMSAVPAQVGTMTAGVILLLGEGLTTTLRFGIGLSIAVVAVAVVATMRPAYQSAIVDAVRRGLVGVFNVPQRGLGGPIDRDAASVLESYLADERPEARAFAATAMAQGPSVDGLAGVERLLDDESAVVRVAAFDSICLLDPDRVDRYVAVALGDEAPEVRLQAVRFLNGRPLEERSAAYDMLGDSDPRVRAAAALVVGGVKGKETADELLAGEAQAVAAMLDEIGQGGPGLGIDPTQFLAHRNPRVRMSAVRAAVASAGDVRLLVPLLDDRSMRVRSSAATGLAGIRDGRELLLEVLQTGTVTATDAAIRALTPVNDLVPEFTAWARREAERAAWLDRMSRALPALPGATTRQFLNRVLERRSARLVQWVLMAMTTKDTAQVMPLVEMGVRSDGGETKAQAIEALETMGDRRVLEVLLPLLDRDERAQNLGEREALGNLTEDFDIWLRALALRCLAEGVESDLHHLRAMADEDESDLVRSAVASLAVMTSEHIDTLNPMDRALALQRVPMFRDLDPEDLELIASVTTEIRYGPEEVIYVKGTEGDEMLLIVDGTAVVTKGSGDSTEVIVSYGAGEHVGELAILGGEARSAHVTAGEDGLHGLVVTKVDLLSILEERPSVAMGMLATLARRLVDQT
jgi:HEAT repeat protein